MSDSVSRLRMFAGPNGSGKSTILSLLRPELRGVYVNADDIEHMLREQGALELGVYGIESTTDSTTRKPKPCC